ncbi:RNA-binding ATPase activator ESF2 [Aspergillus luchuensis]|uniref:Pre-rRNA-processing protein ESF2 n=1 Tax=Aspergillus kawachii TaxID=1069201 RepID=A0A146FL72_ASPKA|nr:RNA-binding ATPase activator esf2 [Aspergillus luchuensis]BCR96866.1 RNA-binding ATPase activator esf2 [Aspergillus luchuensis]BCS09354.1 RNA-binding ATPase activator esf2 [Aspergillus luchuensis]GAA90982.1 pre-rRNA-processing protein Esf2 [Aspergillus luchuensis IFO 4308]GAT26179.1 pre-rRNA-processing protein Esf2 [Aspergillus luchuensis]
MTTRKRNDFLDIVESDDESGHDDRGYDSEAAEQEKSKGRAVKRRRTQPVQSTSDLHGLNDGSEDEDSDNGVGLGDSEDERVVMKGRSKKSKKQAAAAAGGSEDEDDHEEEEEMSDNDEDHYLDARTETTTEESSSKKSTSKKPLDKAKKAPKKNKTGVIYFSSLPPYLKPFALKNLLETRSFGPITRVFLSPEVRPASAPRRRSNKRKTYSDGWVEFASKKTAKICAETLNATIIGGKKGGWYHDDVWNMKYLKGFRWADLMEQVQRERSEREARKRVEDSRARKEDKVFLEGYEKGKVIEGIQKKNEEKGKKKKDSAKDVRMVFKQNEVKLGRDKSVEDPGKLGDDTKRVLGKIF